MVTHQTVPHSIAIELLFPPEPPLFQPSKTTGVIGRRAFMTFYVSENGTARWTRGTLIMLSCRGRLTPAQMFAIHFILDCLGAFRLDIRAGK